jgi:hypothetical protein
MAILKQEYSDSLTSMSNVKSAFESINEPSIWMTDKKAKRQNRALNAAATELKNRGLRKRDNFIEYCKARPSNGSN